MTSAQLKAARDNICAGTFVRSHGFAFMTPAGDACRVIPSPDYSPRARDGMHVTICFWSRGAQPIFEVTAQSLN